MTWNVNGKSPDDLIGLFPLRINEIDMYIFAFQELDLSTEAYISYDPTKQLFWSNKLIEILGDQYIEVCAKQLIGIVVIIFAKRHVEVTQISSVSREREFLGWEIKEVWGVV